MGSACIVLGFAYGNRKNIRGILVNGRGQRYVNEDVYQSLHGEIALRRADIHKALVIRPWKLSSDTLIGGATETGHGRQELLQARRVRIQCREKRLSATFGLVLQFTGAQRLGQMLVLLGYAPVWGFQLPAL